MSKLFKVMKGEPVELQHLRYPLWVTPKINGVRGYVRDNKVLSTANKLLPNVNLQMEFSGLHHRDGEFVVGDPRDSRFSLNRTTSVVMSDDKPILDLKLYAFDHVEFPTKPYSERIDLLNKAGKHSRLVVLKNKSIRCETELLDTEANFV